MSWRINLAAVVIAFGASDQATPQSITWKEYVNPRFAFQVCYPDWLKAGQASGNGDGRVFTDNSGGEMRVWGSYATMVLANGREQLSDEAPPSTVVRQAADYEARSLSRVTYRTVHRDWYALSGTSKDEIVYLKTIVADDRWITVQLTYPFSAASKWNPVVRHITACLKALPPAQFDPQVRQP